MKRKIFELEWSSYGGHKITVMSEHYNGVVRGGMTSKAGALWLGKTIPSMVSRVEKGKGSLISVWMKDAWSKICIRLQQNFGGRFFQLELSMEDSAFEDVHLLIPKEREGEGSINLIMEM